MMAVHNEQLNGGVSAVNIKWAGSQPPRRIRQVTAL